MNTERILEQNKSLRNALMTIIQFKKDDLNNIFSPLFDIAERALNANQPSFIVLKQIDGVGSIYKLEIAKNTLKVLKQELITELPSGCSVEEFCTLLAEGNRLNVPINK